MIGIICVMLAMYLSLGLAMNSKLPVQIAYSLPSLPFIFILFRYVRDIHVLAQKRSVVMYVEP
jgi:hypothetical protein